MVHSWNLLVLVALMGPVIAMPTTPASPLLKRSVTCLTVGASATATWTNAAGQSCSFVGVVGSNYGTNAAGGDYSCNGRCGSGCSGVGLGNVYSQDCFSHDICSYFNDATGGASDPNCGAAYKAAEDDYLLGAANGCSKTNPTNAAVAPSTTPKCN
ncbi:hypothetical protein FJTKL_01434 [Diaporthe vaccinii]|uniref:DUF8213 domain-containing protein n=1 Tax=Diaporthe vaccinii TaxID=105482 RepID=A0ABR4E0U9_9PEZI